MCRAQLLKFLLMVSDETTDDDNNGTSDEDVVRPRFDFRHAESGSYGQNNQADNQYNR